MEDQKFSISPLKTIELKNLPFTYEMHKGGNNQSKHNAHKSELLFTLTLN